MKRVAQTTAVGPHAAGEVTHAYRDGISRDFQKRMRETPDWQFCESQAVVGLNVRRGETRVCAPEADLGSQDLEMERL